MKVTNEIKLEDFKFWSYAKNHRTKFSKKELEELEYILEDIQEGWDETQLNDLFWFDVEILCEWLGLDYDEWIEREDDYIYTNM